jgi:drug/metabolite transporter (DMT)-like permease
MEEIALDMMGKSPAGGAEYKRALVLTLAAPVFWSFGGIGIRLVDADPWVIAVPYDSGVYFLAGTLGDTSSVQGHRHFRLAGKRVPRGRHPVVLLATAPFFSAILGWLVLKERVRMRTWLAILLAMTGVFIMVLDSVGRGRLLGDLLGLGCAVTLAGHIVTVRLGHRVSMIPAVCLAAFICAAATGLMVDILQISIRDIGILAFLGTFQLGLGFCLFVTGSRHLPSAHSGIITLLEAVLGPLWVWIFLGEQPSQGGFIGGIIVVTSLVTHTIVASCHMTRPHSS